MPKKKPAAASSSEPDRQMLGARIETKLARLLKANASRDGKTVQELVEMLVRDYLKRSGDLK
jgi:hypothetical protein